MVIALNSWPDKKSRGLGPENDCKELNLITRFTCRNRHICLLQYTSPSRIAYRYNA